MSLITGKRQAFNYAWIEPVLLISFYLFVSLSSIRNLGVTSAIGFLILLSLCSLFKPRTGVVVLLSIFYLPTYQLGIPAPFIIATAVVALFNFNCITKKLGYKVNRRLLLLYSLFLLLRFLSVIFVQNSDAFWSYFFTSFSVFIHIIIISNLIESKDDIFFILRMWGVVGALSAVLGYLHFTMQDSVYLRQIYVAAGDYDKSTISGTFEFVRWIWAGVEPNFAGLQLLIPFAINFNFLLKKKNFFNIILTVVTFMGILGTYSRSSFLFAIIIVFMFFVLSGSLKNKILFIFLFIISGVLMIDYFSEFIDRIDSISEALNDNDASGRFPLYKEAIRNFIENPIFGIGTGQTRYLSSYRLESHNLFLQTLGENGIVAFIILLLVFSNYFKYAYALKLETILYLIAGVAVTLNANTVSYFDLRTFFTLFVLLNYAVYFNKRVSNIIKSQVKI